MKAWTASSLALLAALSILAVGFTAAGIFGGQRIPELLQVTARGVVPPGFVAVLGKQSYYTVWLAIEEEENTADQNLDRVAFLPPGAEVEIIDLSSGEIIELVQKLPVRRKAGGESTVSYGEFRSERPGQQIQLKASGLNEPVTMSVMPSNLGRVLRVSIGLIGITVVTITVALFVFYGISKWAGEPTVTVE